MAKLSVTQTEYGDWEAMTSVGQVFRLAEVNGRLEVRVQEGHVAITPQASNTIQVAAVDWFGQEVGK